MNDDEIKERKNRLANISDVSVRFLPGCHYVNALEAMRILALDMPRCKIEGKFNGITITMVYGDGL